MAYFAKLDENNIVISRHTIHNNELLDENGIEQEIKGIEFLNALYGLANWKQTSYNGNFRKNYAEIGDTYRSDIDAFVAPQPYPSWVLNEDTCQWKAPVDMPIDNQKYVWSENNQLWEVSSGT